MANINEVIDQNGNHNPIEDSTARSAISAIKNGTSIDNFAAVESALLGKVDTVTGKGLSTNDYSNADAAKVSNLANIKTIGSGLSLNSSTGELTATGISINIDDVIDNTSTNPVQNMVIAEALADKVDAVNGKGLSTNDYTDIDKGIVDGVTQALSGKQDTISDLATIRSGASAGATAYQKPVSGIPGTDLSSAVQTSLGKADTAVQDVTGKADKVSNATNGNFASLNASGNLTDSGKKASDFMASDGVVANPSGTATGTLTKLQIDSTVYSISGGGGGSTVTVDTDGAGSSSSAKYQRVNVDSTHYEIEGTRYMESSSKSTSSGTDTFTFTNVTDASNKVFDYYCDKFGVAPTGVTISGTTVNVIFASSDNVTKCRIYIRG